MVRDKSACPKIYYQARIKTRKMIDIRSHHSTVTQSRRRSEQNFGRRAVTLTSVQQNYCIRCYIYQSQCSQPEATPTALILVRRHSLWELKKQFFPFSSVVSCPHQPPGCDAVSYTSLFVAFLSSLFAKSRAISNYAFLIQLYLMMWPKYRSFVVFTLIADILILRLFQELSC